MLCKIESHTGIEFNEEADRLARNALLAKGYKTYDDGSVYFVGYNSDDWSAIVDYINDENNELLHDTIPAINVQTSSIGNREKIKLVQGKTQLLLIATNNLNLMFKENKRFCFKN